MLEGELWNRGYRRIAGIDEAGRGCLAGPLVAACVVFPAGSDITHYQDSKTLRPDVRARLFDHILRVAISLGIGLADERLIDQVGIQQANRYAFREAWQQTFHRSPPDYLLLDWLKLPGIPIPSQALCHAESHSYTVAAASIVAKVWRDRLMQDWYHLLYPQYGFCSHKGYGTKLHRDRISSFGLSQAHRRSFCGKFTQDVSPGTQRGAGSQAICRETPEDDYPRDQLSFLHG